jgi:CBS domain-containing protein
MFLGASLGSAYGKVLAANLPAIAPHIAAPPAYAMVGMAAVLAGTAKAPLTAILLLFELTRDYRIVLPLMAAVGLAAWLVEGSKVRNDSELNPEQMGFNVAPDRNLEILQEMSVAEAMHESWVMLKDTQSVLEAGLALTQGRSYSALVFDCTDRLIGIISLQDIERAIALGESDSGTVPWSEQAIAEICTLEVLYAYPDELLSEALDRMAARGLRQLPVVDPDDPHRVLGLLDREGISLACNVATVAEALTPYVLLPNAVPSLELSKRRSGGLGNST